VIFDSSVDGATFQPRHSEPAPFNVTNIEARVGVWSDDSGADEAQFDNFNLPPPSP
jgi:hypothetical protein